MMSKLSREAMCIYRVKGACNKTTSIVLLALQSKQKKRKEFRASKLDKKAKLSLI